MAHLSGSAHEIRARVPAVLESYEYIRDNVLCAGVVDRPIKDLCFRFLADESRAVGSSGFDERQRAAIEWAYAIACDSDKADDALWARLHAHFTEPELVDLGCAIGFELGQQHWRRTVGLSPLDL